MKTLKCCVVLSTYNGMKYVLNQLESLRSQSRTPDEVIIGDDCSTDTTVKVIENYIKGNHLDWKVLSSKKNRGYYYNFMTLAYQASSDIVFFCDQDDIWKTDKIETMMGYFERNEKWLAISCNVQYVNKEGDEIKSSDYFNVNKITRIDLKDILYTSNILGCTLGFRKNLLNLVDQSRLEATIGSHDTLISILAAAKHGLYKIPYVGVDYRVHGQNTSMKKGIPRLKQIERLKCFYCDLNEALVKDNDITEKMRRKIEIVAKLQTNRIQWFKTGDIWHHIYYLSEYFDFTGSIYRGIRLFGADLYYYHKNGT